MNFRELRILKKIITSAFITTLSVVALSACSSGSTQSVSAACDTLAANQAEVASKMAGLAASPDTMDEMVTVFRSTGDRVENEEVKNIFDKIVSISERSTEMAKEAARLDAGVVLDDESAEKLNELMEEFTGLQEEADSAYRELNKLCPSIKNPSSEGEHEKNWMDNEARISEEENASRRLDNEASLNEQ